MTTGTATVRTTDRINQANSNANRRPMGVSLLVDGINCANCGQWIEFPFESEVCPNCGESTAATIAEFEKKRRAFREAATIVRFERRKLKERQLEEKYSKAPEEKTPHTFRLSNEALRWLQKEKKHRKKVDPERADLGDIVEDALREYREKHEKK